MIGEWLLEGSKWGFMVASAIITAIAVMGVVMGVTGFVCWLIKGGDDENKDQKNDKIRPV